MHSIRRRLTFILISCTMLTLLFSAIFVNLAINNTFNKYISDNQEMRNERIVSYFEEVYKRDLNWTADSGKEIQHEGYMSNYCLTLLDKDKNVIWAMNPEEILNMSGKNAGNEYRTATFDITYQGKAVGYVIIGQYEPVLVSEQDINFKLSINRSIAVSVVVAIAFASLISIYFSKQFSNPIKAVSETSVDLTEGKYTSKAVMKSNVLEIDNLIKSINILGEKLKYQDELRKRLVSDVSHEIRTPLNIFQNNLEAMIDGVFPVTTDRLINLNDEVIRFGRLLNNLDALKELEETNVELHMQRVDLEELIVKLTDIFSMHSKRNNIAVSLQIKPKQKYFILGDEDKLRQVFYNILSNAFKFTNSGGTVAINLTSDKDFIYLSVKDNGIGINKQDLPFIFERLYRGDKSRNQVEGNGIGLTITKQILLHHSASIDVDSEEGVGTNVRVKFVK
ncbi:two-component sensor histidine kinase [Anaerocolumna chitinilytica]|uniref:histidine kinase n=2 Tax=Anaerocolumna chitinilytica TaxID=1727145 RepID=A0A7I8DJA0_9FIRM|nr:HAMP domain-containing sensor histidine kinase [Anaerocolumna chitinilytica]BCJ98440.1 two-component sensor histidine kinase [Anaerocolumna chitinilytica]